MVRPDLEARGYRVFEVSAVAHTGLKELSFALPAPGSSPRRRATSRRRRRPESSSGPRPSTTPASRCAVERRTGVFRVRGEKPERWVRQTDFNNDEAVGYLADRLNRLGVEDALIKAGARAGDGVPIGPEDNAVVFDWEPTMAAGAEMLGRPRGSDLRLEAEGGRKTRDERRAHFHARKDAQTAARDKHAARSVRPGTGRPWPTRTDADAGSGRPAGRTVGEGHRLVVKVGSSSLTTTGGGTSTWTRCARSSTCWPRAGRPATRSCSSRPGRSRPASVRSACRGGRPTSRPSRRPPRWARGCSSRRTGGLRPARAHRRQVLLTAGRRAPGARTTRTPGARWSGCWTLGVVPIVNENDTVATHEIRFGDNDRLAALVSDLVAADGLVLLSDVDARLRRAALSGWVTSGAARRDHRGPRRRRRSSGTGSRSAAAAW